jgi:hypothetical protein
MTPPDDQVRIRHMRDAVEKALRYTQGSSRQSLEDDEILHTVRAPEALLAKPYLRPVYDESGGGDGFVSLEVSGYFGGIPDLDAVFAQVIRGAVTAAVLEATGPNG